MLITDDIYLSGVVVANDKLGELTKAIVVEDDSGGVVVEIDMDDVYQHYPLYSRVEIGCTGLWLGCIGPKLMLGAEPVGDYVVDRLPQSKIGNYISLLDDKNDTPTHRQRRVAELEYRDMLCRVSVADLCLIPEEQTLRWADCDTLTGRYRTSLRHFCQDGDTLRVVVDANCSYASEEISSKPLRLTGILDWYGGGPALRIIDHAVYSD